MHYIIQENVFREHNYDAIVEALNRLGLEYSTVKIFPYVDKIVDIKNIPESAYEVDDLPEFQIDRKDLFVFGALKLARISTNKGWNPGSLMNSNHDYNVYKNYYKENLLNYDSIITTFDSKFEFECDKFIRPCLDSKSFTGRVFSKQEWEEFVTHSKDNGHTSNLTNDTEIQVSSVKNIYKEIRFWVVGGKVITGSQYKLGRSVICDSFYEDDASQFAQSMVDIFQLAKAFCIDVCITEDGWKIVEAGCINCAGFYLADLQKVLIELEGIKW